MTINITIGKKETSAPMFPCSTAKPPYEGCRAAACRECLSLVRQEMRSEAPPVHTATAAGVKVGGYNFACGIPMGFYYRILTETPLAQRYPFFDIPTNDPLTFSIPDTLPGYLHMLAVDVEMGVVKTSYPQQDAEFICWMAWWTGYAIRTYGLQAAILFD